MAAAVRILTPRWPQDSCPPFSSIHHFSRRCHAEVLRPHHHRHLRWQHCGVRTVFVYQHHDITDLFFLPPTMKLFIPTGPWRDRAAGYLISLVPSWRPTWGGSGTPSRVWSGTRKKLLSRKWTVVQVSGFTSRVGLDFWPQLLRSKRQSVKCGFGFLGLWK